VALSPEKVNAVRSSYVHERLPLESAAKKHKVNYNTARNWKKRAKLKGDDWDKARGAFRMAEGGLGDITLAVLEDFTLLLKSTIGNLKSKENIDPIEAAKALAMLADAYTKTMKAAAQGNPKIAKLSVALEVLALLAKFIKEKHPQDLECFTKILEPFGAKVSEVFG